MKEDRKKIAICVARMQSDIRKKHIQAICREARNRQYDTFIFNVFCTMDYTTNFAKGEAHILDMVPIHKLEALILFTESFLNIEVAMKLVERAREAGVPVISVDYHLDGCYNIMFAYEESFEKIIRHVVEFHGCKKVNFMAGFKGNTFSDARIRTFQKVLADNHIEFEKDRLAYGQFWETPARKNCERWIKMWENGEQERPEAIICANDIMALTVCNVLTNHGIRIPDDMILTGFDGLELEQYCTPRLTMARDDLELLGREFLDMVDKCGQEAAEPYEVRIPFQTVFSESCGCEPIRECNSNEQIMYLYDRGAEMRTRSTETFLMMSELTDGYSAVDMARKLSQYKDMMGVDSAMIFLNRKFYSETDIPCENLGKESMVLLAQIRQGKYTAPLIEIPNHKEYDAMHWMFQEVSQVVFIPLHCLGENYGFLAVSYEEISKDIGAFYEFILSFEQVLGIIRRQSQLHKVYITDMMTGLSNRRGFFSLLEKKIRELQGKEKDILLFLASIDMDGLKYINDNYGHPEGDFAINTIARFLRGSVERYQGAEGICARFGGDEFMIAIVDEECIADTAFFDDYEQELNKRIEQFNKRTSKPYQLGVSTGTIYRRIVDQDDVHRLLKMVDDVMYECKYEHHLSRAVRSRDMIWGETEENS